MRSFDFGPLAADQAVKIVGNAMTVKFNATGATNLIVCVKAGHKSDSLSELETIYGIQFTRFTLNGTDTKSITIDGMTPGLYVAGSVISGTGTLSVSILTGQE